MRTVRLIIYDGPGGWMESQRAKDLQTPFFITRPITGDPCVIRSIEIDPATIELIENQDSANLGTLIISGQKIDNVRLERDK